MPVYSVRAGVRWEALISARDIISLLAGIYISWPFCAQKCTYCNFASGVLPRELEAGYVSALLKEIAAHRWEWPAETLFIGGGTPSGMEPAELTRLLGAFPASSMA